MDTNLNEIKPVVEKAQDSGNKFLKTSMIVAIVIVMNLFFNYAVSLVFNEPVYDEYVKPVQVRVAITTKEDCLSIGGGWSENVFPGEKGKTKVEGYCDENYTNMQNYNKDRAAYDKKVFITLLSLGVVSLAVAGFIVISILSVSFAWGGVLSFIIASMRYWSSADSLAKVVILAIAFGLLVWLAIKKFNK